MSHSRDAFRLLPRARTDLAEIWNYAEGRWSPSQAETYIERIRQSVFAPAEGRRHGRPVDEVREGYRQLRIASHLIIYRDEGEMVTIVRILHACMDVTRHLRPR